jgi:hypothetical protein
VSATVSACGGCLAGDDLQQLTQGRTLRGSATCPGIMFPPTPCACVASFATQSAARPNHVSRRLHSSCGGHAFSVNSTFSTPIRPPAPSGVVDQLVCPPRYSLLPRRAAPPGPPRIIRVLTEKSFASDPQVAYAQPSEGVWAYPATALSSSHPTVLFPPHRLGLWPLRVFRLFTSVSLSCSPPHSPPITSLVMIFSQVRSSRTL